MTSYNTSIRTEIISPTLKNCIFGINAIKLIIDNIGDNIRNIKYDVRIIYLLYEHKKCMLDRIKYMVKNKYLGNEGNIYDHYKEIVNQMIIVKNMYLKYEYTKNNDLLLMIKARLSNMLNAEYVILIELVSMIQFDET